MLAPDSYKGSLTARQACDAMEQGIRRIVPDAEILKTPMADGGEGTVQSLVDATGGSIIKMEVSGPLGDPVRAKFGILGDGTTAVIEMAEASGLYLIHADRRNPLLTSTYGTGQLIRNALDLGCRSFIIGLGGSATNDGGAGMAQALGVKLLDGLGRELSAGGGRLGELRRIDLDGMDERLRDCVFEAACDVDHPLCGRNGASAIFGPQKGATPEMADQLDRNLAQYASVILRDMGRDVIDMPGGGAAGGMGAGLTAFLGARLRSGVEMVLDAVAMDERLSGADLVFTGEGRCDGQTARGKTPYGVAKRAKAAGVPVILVAGSIGEGIEEMYRHGVQSAFSLIDGPMPVEQAMSDAPRLLANTVERIMRLTAE